MQIVAGRGFSALGGHELILIPRRSFGWGTAAFTSERRVVAFGSAAARLMRAFATQVEVLRRLRNGGQQFVRVEHVHINDGGQAVVGNFKKSEGQA